MKLKAALFFLFFYFSPGLSAQRHAELNESYNRLVEEYGKKGYWPLQDQDCGYLDFRRGIAYRIKFNKPAGKVNWRRHGGTVRVKEITLIINDQGKVLKKRVRRYREYNISG